MSALFRPPLVWAVIATAVVITALAVFALSERVSGTLDASPADTGSLVQVDPTTGVVVIENAFVCLDKALPEDCGRKTVQGVLGDCVSIGNRLFRRLSYGAITWYVDPVSVADDVLFCVDRPTPGRRWTVVVL